MRRAIQYFWRRLQGNASSLDEDFVIQIQPPQGERFPVEVLSSPAGMGLGNFRIPAPITGEALFNALFEGRVRNLYQQSIGILAQKAARQLRIRLRINSAEPGLTEIADLSWESLTDPDSHEPLILSADYSIVRDVLSGRHRPLDFPASLLLLAVVSRPKGLVNLNLSTECKLVREACAGTSVKAEFLEKPTRSFLRQKLQELEKKQGGVHILHFMGHGQKNNRTKEGEILLEQKDGSPDPVGGKELAVLFSEFKTIRLLVLNSCNTAGISFSSVASRMLLYGFPAVLAMRSKFSDRAAIVFSKAFYNQLASGAPTEAAVREGRLAVQAMPCSEWEIPVLFLPSFEKRRRPWWRWIMAAVTMVSLSLAKVFLFQPRPAKDHPRPVVEIDFPNHAKVPLELTVSGYAREHNSFYYLFVRDPREMKCYIQNNGPLQPDQDGKWQALAQFSGSPGQAFQLVAVATPRLLTQSELWKCGAGIPGIKSADRFVQLDGTLERVQDSK